MPAASIHPRPASALRARLFDRFVCRVAGLPAGAIEALRGEGVAAAVDEIARLEKKLRQAREPLSERLHRLVAEAIEDRDRRRALIALRRDVYNLRPIDPSRLELLPLALRREVEALLDLTVELTSLHRAFERSYEVDALAARRAFREALRDEDFQSALLLSSRTLFEAQKRYARANPARLRTRERQIERGLLKYWTRMVMKATPFASFCAIVPGRLDESSGPRLRFVGEPLRKRGLVRINKRLCGEISRRLLEEAAVRRHFRVELNPTLRRRPDGSWAFLATLDGREVFQRLAPAPALDVLFPILAGGSRQSLGELARDLVARPEIDAPRETVDAYLERLIEIGLLRLGTGVPSQELDWDLALRDRLAAIDAEPAARAHRLLRRLRELAHAYAGAASARRAELLGRMEDLWDDYRDGHEARARITSPLFEDASAAATAVLGSEGLEPLERTLSRYVELTRRIALGRRELANLRHFYDARYGEGVESVPLLSFYETYYREHYKEHLERLARSHGAAAVDDGYDLANPFGLELVRRILEARQRLADLLAERWAASANELRLCADDLESLVKDVDPLPADDPCSVSFFCEILGGGREGPRLHLRRGGYQIGYGKMFSRFLYLFPSSFTDAVRRNNEGMTPELLAGLCDDADFNANLHPPVMPEEISYPIGSGRPQTEAVSPTELEVVRDTANGSSLWLRHAPTGRRVHPVDTGFLNPAARPPLYRLLLCFTPAQSFLLPMPERSAEGGPANVVSRPRTVFEDRLVLTRCSWWIPGGAFPRQRSGESEREYFLRVGRWRREHGIPREVYLRFQLQPGTAERAAARDEVPHLDPPTAGQEETGDGTKEREPRPEQGDAPQGARPRFKRDLEKPQYVDFDSPLLVGLLGHAAFDEAEVVAILEERLPDDQALVRHGDDVFVTELVFQLDFPQAAPS